MTPAQIRFVSLWIHLTGIAMGAQIRANLANNAASDLILKHQYVAQIAFVTLRPEMPVGIRLNELCRNAHSVACPEH